MAIAETMVENCKHHNISFWFYNVHVHVADMTPQYVYDTTTYPDQVSMLYLFVGHISVLIIHVTAKSLRTYILSDASEKLALSRLCLGVHTTLTAWYL